jgi:hypothetical protein
VLNHPEIGALYLGGAVSDTQTPEAKAAEERAAEPDPQSAANGTVSNGTSPGAAR